MKKWILLFILLLDFLVLAIDLKDMGIAFFIVVSLSACSYPIFFAEQIGTRTDYWIRGRYISEPTPPIIIEGFGWAGLIVSSIVFIWHFIRVRF